MNLRSELVKDPEAFYQRCQNILASIPRTTGFIIISPLKLEVLVEFIRFLSNNGYKVYAIVPLSHARERETALKEEHIRNSNLIDLLANELLVFDEMKIKSRVPAGVISLFWDTRTPLKELTFRGI